jgi:hypothetical protein
MQRVRIGLTGLAVVFLLVILAAAIFGVVGVGDQDGSAAIDGNSTQIDDDPKEPLAELGVAPGNAPPEKPAASAPKPKP